jgi:CheY-like chemotaxis protein
VIDIGIPVSVLLVDDNPAKRSALAAALTGLDLDIVTAATGTVGRFLRANRIIGHLLGYTPAELAHLTPLDIQVAVWMKRVDDALSAAKAAGRDQVRVHPSAIPAVPMLESNQDT